MDANNTHEGMEKNEVSYREYVGIWSRLLALHLGRDWTFGDV